MQRAEALVHAPPHLLYIARSQASLGKLVAARETYLKVIREDLLPSAPRAFKDAQERAKEEAAAIEPRIAQLRIVVEGAGDKKVTVKLDGQPVPPALIGVHRPVDPGKHRVVAYTVGLSPVEKAIELKDGEKSEVKLAVSGAGSGGSGVPLDPSDDPDAPLRNQPPPDSTKGGGVPVLGIVGIGVGVAGVAGVVVGSVFLAKRGSLAGKADDMFTTCNKTPPCSQQEQAAIKATDADAASAGTVGIIGVVAGGVFLAGGVTLAVLGFTAKKEAAPKASTGWIAPYVAPNGVGVRGAF
jgi:hypothetical protein